MRQSTFKTLVYLCFLLSGAAGLIYEVVWARQLGLFLGITSYAHTAVITAYMAGLAAGSLYFGRRADAHSQPLRVYAWLEVGVGVYAALTPWLIGALQSGYTGIAGVAGITGTQSHLVRFAIALAALLVPTFLMGGTLPLLVRGFTNSLPDLGRVTSRLYGINTLGAMAGTLVAGYVLLPWLGVSRSIYVGVAINLAIAVFIFRLIPRLQSNKDQPREESKTAEPDNVQGGRAFLLAGFAAAGFASLLTQLAWIRALILVVGGSVYAFTITLGTFLAGIGLGSLLYRQIAGRQPGMARAALLAAGISLTTLATLPLIGKLPGLFLHGWSAGLHESFPLFQLFIFTLGFAVMIIPTLLMGALFPLITVIWTQRVSHTGRGVGGAYATNTLGTIFGALLGGLVLLPMLGVQGGITLSSAIYAAVAILFWLGASSEVSILRRLGVVIAGGVVFVLVLQVMPAWDRALMTNGVYFRPAALIQKLENNTLDEIVRQEELIYYAEGLDGTVTVRADSEQKYLVINGKTDASSVSDLGTQVLLGQLPALLHPNPQSALIIGLGSGVTAASVATHESVQEITVLELQEEVIEASDLFRDENNNVLDDPRVNMLLADARNFVMATDQEFDLVISEPSNPWISGVSNLFTSDFFQLAKDRLAPGGLMTQWFHIYSMSEADLKLVLRTFKTNFAHTSVWHPQGGDLLLIGSDEPHSLDVARLQQMLANPDTGRDLQRSGNGTALNLVHRYLFGGDNLDSYVEGEALNTDDRPIIEFNAPRNLYSSFASQTLSNIVSHLETRSVSVPLTGLISSREGGFDLSAMRLTVGLPDGLLVSGMQTSWNLSRRGLTVEGNEAFEITSDRQALWNEGSAIQQVQATWQPRAVDPANPYRFSSLLRVPFKASGNFAGGGSWVAGHDAESSTLEFAMVWSCSVPGGGATRYIVIGTAPGPADVDWQAVIDGQASRYRCY